MNPEIPLFYDTQSLDYEIDYEIYMMDRKIMPIYIELLKGMEQRKKK